MRGVPWIRFLGMLVALAVAGIPVWLLTRPDEEPAAPTGAAAAQAVITQRTVNLEIQTAPPAQSIQVSYLGHPVLSKGANKPGALTGPVLLPSGESGDLVIEAHWAEGETGALRARASNDDGELAENSFWGDSSLEDVFTIPVTAP